MTRIYFLPVSALLSSYLFYIQFTHNAPIVRLTPRHQDTHRVALRVLAQFIAGDPLSLLHSYSGHVFILNAKIQITSRKLPAGNEDKCVHPFARSLVVQPRARTKGIIANSTVMATFFTRLLSTKHQEPSSTP